MGTLNLATNFLHDEIQARSYLRDGLAMGSMASREPRFLVSPSDKCLEVRWPRPARGERTVSRGTTGPLARSAPRGDVILSHLLVRIVERPILGPREANCLRLARVSAARRRVLRPFCHSGTRQHSHDRINLDILCYLENKTPVKTAGDHLDGLSIA